MTTTHADERPTPVQHQALGVVLVLVSAAAFGSGAFFVQPLYAADMAPLAVLFWRFTTAALFGWGYLLISRRRVAALRGLSRRRLVVLLLLGGLYVGNSYAFIASLQVVPISLASIIAYLYPAIVAVMATRLVRGLEGRRAWFALGLSVFGVALTVGGIPAGELPPLWGLALAFANPFIYATWIVLQARLAGDRPRRAHGRRRQAAAMGGNADAPPADPGLEIPPADRGAETAPDDPGLEIPPADAETITDAPDPAPAAALMTTATAVVYAVLLLASGGSIAPLAVPEGTWPALLGLGLVSTAIAIQTFYAGVRRVGGARASLISTVEPVYTVVLAMILFGERLTTLQVVGGSLVIVAVILAETGRRARVAST